MVGMRLNHPESSQKIWLGYKTGLQTGAEGVGVLIASNGHFAPN